MMMFSSSFKAPCGSVGARTSSYKKNIPDGEDTAGLSETRLLLDTANSLLEDGRDLSWGCLGLGVCAGLEGGNCGCGISLQLETTPVSLAERPTSKRHNM